MGYCCQVTVRPGRQRCCHIGRVVTGRSSLWPPRRTASSELVPAASSVAREVALKSKGISLSQLLAGVTQAVAQAFSSVVWTLVEVVQAIINGGHVYFATSERIEFWPPDIGTAAKLCHDWMLRSAATFTEDFNGRSVAHCLEGETPANISAILQQAVNLMIERKLRISRATKVTLKDIEAACLTING